MGGLVHRQHSIDYYEVCHIDDEHDNREAEVPYVPASDTFTVEDAVVVQIIDADTAKVTV